MINDKGLTVGELHELLAKAVADGLSDSPVFFDTEARTFDCHLVAVGQATLETDPDLIGLTSPDKPGILILATRYH